MSEFNPEKAQAFLASLWRWRHLIPGQFHEPLAEALGKKVCTAHPEKGELLPGDCCPYCVERDRQRAAFKLGVGCAGKPKCDYVEEGWHTVFCPLHRDNIERAMHDAMFPKEP